MIEPHLVELRGMCPREIIDVLDAVSVADRISRTEQVNKILGEWCERHRLSALSRGTREAARKVNGNDR